MNYMEEQTAIPYETFFLCSDEAISVQSISLDNLGHPASLKFEAMNAAFERLTGLRGAEVKGRVIQDVVPVEFLEWVECLSEVARTGKAKVRHLYRKETGRWLASRFVLHSKKWIILSVIDITEVVVAHQNCQEKDRLGESFFELPSAIHLITDPSSGYILNANNRALDFYGWNLRELQKLRTVDIEVRLPKDPSWEDKRSHVGAPFPPPCLHRTKDGQWRTVEVLSGFGRYFGRSVILSVVREMPETFPSASQFVYPNRISLLGYLINGLCGEVEAFLSQLGELLESLGQRVPRGDVEDSLVVRTNREIARMKSLVNSVNHLARAQGLAAQRLQIRSLIEEALELKVWALQETHVEVNCFPGEEDWACVDRVLMLEVFLSLLEFSIEAAANEAAPRITFDVRVSDSHVTIRIANNGYIANSRTGFVLGTPFFGLDKSALGWEGDLRVSFVSAILLTQGGSLSVKRESGVAFEVELTKSGPEEK